MMGSSPVANPVCWGSIIAIPLNLTMPALGGHERRDPASVQRRISPSDGVDRVLGQYELVVNLTVSIIPLPAEVAR